MEAPPTTGTARRGTRVVLWIIAVMLMLLAAGYQRRTGPTYPYDGSFAYAGQELDYELLTSHVSSGDAPVTVPWPGDGPAGTLHYRRYPTDDPFTAVPLTVADGEARAVLPAQPPAGKLEYYLELEPPSGTVRIPSSSEDDIIIRFKGAVPLYVLLPHVLLMFLSMLVGVRAGLAALFGTGETRPLAWTTLFGLTLGGMIMGPVVQEYAFGAFWTGVPFGWDLTDNKTLLMWLGWLIACLVLGWREKGRDRLGRWLVLGATVVMLAVYLIPHSLRGSELDYDQLEQGVSPEDAVRTG